MDSLHRKRDGLQTLIRTFVKKEPVLVIAALAAAVSCFFVPPDGAYFSYIDLRTLALLYCLMTVVAGLRQAGLFEHLAQEVCERSGSLRMLSILLVLLCFFTSMLITNDVALLTFVPFAVIVLGMSGRLQHLIRIVVLQTVAANLGSMLTPVGNPQNLYLYSYYGLGMGEFLGITFPVWGLSLLLILAACFVFPKEKLEIHLGKYREIDRRELLVHSLLFSVCLLTVLRILPWQGMLAILIAVLFVFDRGILKEADFMLLLTFVAFFVFSGNLARMDSVAALLEHLMEGREYLTSLLASQVISNVPAALLLSGFTDRARDLILGVDIGGLGTPIASLASLISLKLYLHSDDAKAGRYLLEFTAVNVLLLAILSGAAMILK